MPSLYTMESANIFAGAQPSEVTASNHLALTEVKLPGVDQQFVDHRAGGSLVTVEIDTIIARLECTFTLLGWNPQVAGLIASWEAQDMQFFIYGNIRDRASGGSVQATAQMIGKLGRADPQNWRKGEAQHWTYAIRGITTYLLQMGDQEMYFFDFYGNVFRVGGHTVMADTNQNLLIPSASVNIVQPAPTTPLSNRG